MKKVLLYIVATFFVFAQANAQNFSIGVSGNVSVFAGTGIEIEYSESGTVSNRTKEYGAFADEYPSIFVEWGNDVVSIGLDYVPVAIESPQNINTSSSTTPTSKVQVDFENHMTFYGLVRAPWLGLYLKGGVTDADVIINESQRSGNTYKDQSTGGYMAAIGSEIDAGGVAWRIEIAGYSYDDVNANNGVATSGNRNEVSVESAIGATGRLSLVKTF